MKKNYFLKCILLSVSALSSLCSQAFIFEGIDYEVIPDGKNNCKVNQVLASQFGPLNIPAKVKSWDFGVESEWTVVEIGEKAFINCEADEISLPSTIEIISEGAFMEMPNLERVVFPSEASKVNIAKFAFASNPSLREVSIKSNGLLTIGESAFQDCSALIKASFSAARSQDVNNPYIDIYPKAFLNCNKLSQIEFKANTIAIRNDNCFGQCSNLHSIVMPASFAECSNNPFFDCWDLKDIYVVGAKLQDQQVDLGETGELDEVEGDHRICNIVRVHLPKKWGKSSLPKPWVDFKDKVFEENLTSNTLQLQTAASIPNNSLVSVSPETDSNQKSQTTAGNKYLYVSFGENQFMKHSKFHK